VSGLPARRRGYQSPEAIAAYEAAVAAFCAMLREMQSTVDFKMSARGWAYALENDGIITKGQLDAAQKVINDCRKSGALPIGFTAEDEARATFGDWAIDDTTPEEEARDIVLRMESAYRSYWPFSFWRDETHYVQMLVEKIDLRELFKPVCEEFNVPLINGGGWSDINSRAVIAGRFREWEAQGKQCVLVYCGDHDPGGVLISEYIIKNFADIAGAVGWRPDNLIVDRFGLNADFIRRHRLPWIEGLETSSGGRLDDPRHPDHRKPYVQSYLEKFGPRKVEANALVTRPAAGRDLCRRAILKYVDEGAPAAYERRIGVEQLKVQRLVQALVGRRRR
jgi:hypothetical protein